MSGFQNGGYQRANPMVDDAELLRSYADDRSEPAFAELVRRHVDLVYSAALRRVGGDAHLAEDVCQKVFVGLASQVGSLRQRSSITGWLYTASRFAAAEVVRGEQRRRAREQEVFVMQELLGDSGPDPEWEKLRPILDDSMDQLSERDREALLLRFFENRPLAEVGRKLDVTEEAARKRVDRALERLRSVFAKHGIGSTSAALAVLLANQAVAAAPASVPSAMTAALLPARGAMAPLTGVVSFMNATKTVTGVLGIALLLASGVATYEVRLRREAGVALTVARRDLADVATRQSMLEQTASAAERNLAALRKTADEARTANTAVAERLALKSQAAKAATAWDPVAEGASFFARHPETRSAMIDFANIKTDAKYAELYKTRHLSPEQIEQFRTLMRELAAWPWQYDASGKTLLLDVGSNLSHQEIGPKLAALLGNDGVRELSRINQAAPASEFAVKFAASLSFSDTPVSTEQAQGLTRLIQEHSKTSKTGERTTGWEELMPKAKKFLALPQAEMLDALLAEAAANQQLSQAQASQARGSARPSAAR